MWEASRSGRTASGPVSRFAPREVSIVRSAPSDSTTIVPVASPRFTVAATGVPSRTRNV